MSLFLRFFVVCLLVMSSAIALQAQEIKATVKVGTPKIQKTDPKVFRTLEQEINNFLNSQKWTNDYFENDERIEVNVQITINEEVGTSGFLATLDLKAVRPVFGTDYETVIFSHKDESFNFDYEEFQPIQFIRNSYTDPISHILAFYMYIVIGLDYDSFSKMGGSTYFQEAQSIVNQAPADNTEWQQSKQRNRFWLIESVTSSKSQPFREAIYQMHRKGLDIMHEQPEEGRTQIMEALNKIDEVNRNYLNAFIIQIFENTKSNELIEIFKGGTRTERERFVTIMSKINASKASIYRRVLF